MAIEVLKLTIVNLIIQIILCLVDVKSQFINNSLITKFGGCPLQLNNICKPNTNSTILWEFESCNSIICLTYNDGVSRFSNYWVNNTSLLYNVTSGTLVFENVTYNGTNFVSNIYGDSCLNNPCVIIRGSTYFKFNSTMMSICLSKGNYTLNQTFYGFTQNNFSQFLFQYIYNLLDIGDIIIFDGYTFRSLIYKDICVNNPCVIVRNSNFLQLYHNTSGLSHQYGFINSLILDTICTSNVLNNNTYWVATNVVYSDNIILHDQSYIPEPNAFWNNTQTSNGGINYGNTSELGYHAGLYNLTHIIGNMTQPYFG